MTTNKRCYAAFTEMTPSEPGVYVGFTNMYETDDGQVRLTIRERGMHPTTFANLFMTKEQATTFLTEALASLAAAK